MLPAAVGTTVVTNASSAVNPSPENLLLYCVCAADARSVCDS